MINHSEFIQSWPDENADKISIYSLQVPTTIEKIAHLKRVVSKQLPEDFEVLYLWHNGLTEDENTGSLFFGMDFLPIERIIDDHRNKFRDECDQKPKQAKADQGIDVNGFRTNDWIRFAFDGSDTGLYPDLVPAQRRSFG